MKPQSFSLTLIRCLALAGTALPLHLPVQAQGPGGGQGRGQGGGGGPERGGFQEAIHKLFENHQKIKRTVEMTADGYKSRTLSDDPEIAKTLQKHVKEMRERLGAGLMIRRWDPAFAELVEHYQDIEHEFKEVEGGVEMIAKGKTPDAVKVAQNHAKIVSGFARIGPDQMHETHPRAIGAPEPKPLDPKQKDIPAPAEAGPQIIAEAFSRLTVALTESLAKNGAAKSLEVCSMEAPKIAAEVSKKHGVTVRRATEKPRNLRNAADEAERVILKTFAEELANAKAPQPRTVTRADGQVDFFAPILIASPVCLHATVVPVRRLLPKPRLPSASGILTTKPPATRAANCGACGRSPFRLRPDFGYCYQSAIFA